MRLNAICSLVLCSALVFGHAMFGRAVSGQEAAPSKKVPQPTQAEATQLVSDGDRLADQGDYGAALEKYTQAYHAFVSRIRGQKFTHQVFPNLLTRAQLGKEMLLMMDREYDASEWLLMDSSYKALGLIPQEISSKDLMAKLLTEEVAGFYDPDQKRMVLIREDGPAKEPGFFERLLGSKPTFDKEEQKTTLAHEMTHALQDQLYDLKKLQKRIEKDDDMVMAFSALVEGDATLLMFAEMGDEDITQMDPEAIRATFSIMSFMLPVAGGSTYRKAPAIFRDSLIFPYFQGMVFAISVAGKQGWPAVHAAYSSPPTSTEQILHPDKYTGSTPDQPQRVVLPDLTSAISAPWEHLGGNCLGEFQTNIMLKRQRTARRASEGWDGDRYEVYRQADGRLGLVYVSVWDSPEDAAEFAKCYQQYRQPETISQTSNKGQDEEEAQDAAKVADKKVADKAAKNENPSSTKADSPKDNADDPAAGSVVLGAKNIVRLDGDRVWVIEGFHAETVAAIEALLPQTKCQPKLFPTE
ncbi:MAG: hypothetical protein IT423_07585 [Pirellulaceae bacterium]|nr:hypothetical protein [Pirellulaceae bacterium]